MKDIKIEKVWIAESFQGNGQELRVEWSNDRYHSVLIDYPGNCDCVYEALVKLALYIKNDHHLRHNTDEIL